MTVRYADSPPPVPHATRTSPAARTSLKPGRLAYKLTLHFRLHYSFTRSDLNAPPVPILRVYPPPTAALPATAYSLGLPFGRDAAGRGLLLASTAVAFHPLLSNTTAYTTTILPTRRVAATPLPATSPYLTAAAVDSHHTSPTCPCPTHTLPHYLPRPTHHVIYIYATR